VIYPSTSSYVLLFIPCRHQKNYDPLSKVTTLLQTTMRSTDARSGCFGRSESDG